MKKSASEIGRANVTIVIRTIVIRANVFDSKSLHQSDLVVVFFGFRFTVFGFVGRAFLRFFFRPFLPDFFRLRFFRRVGVEFGMVETEKVLHRNVGFGIQQVDLVVLVVVLLLRDRRFVVVRILKRFFLCVPAPSRNTTTLSKYLWMSKKNQLKP